jgi:hypothetical protein
MAPMIRISGSALSTPGSAEIFSPWIVRPSTDVPTVKASAISGYVLS